MYRLLQMGPFDSKKVRTAAIRHFVRISGRGNQCIGYSKWDLLIRKRLERQSGAHVSRVTLGKRNVHKDKDCGNVAKLLCSAHGVTGGVFFAAWIFSFIAFIC